MLVGMLNTKDTPRGRYLLSCFQDGVRRRGDDAIWIEGLDQLNKLNQVDTAVQICLPNSRVKDGRASLRLPAQELLKKRKKRTVTIDAGFVRGQQEYLERGTAFRLNDRDTYAPADTEIYYEVSLDGIKGRGDHGTSEKMPDDRWKALGVELLPWRTEGHYTLVIGQPLHGQSSQDVNIYEWYHSVFAGIALYAPSTSRVLFRQHPRFCVQARRADSDWELVQGAARGTKILLERSARLDSIGANLYQARSVVSYSSNAAVLAVIAGVPTFTGSPTSMAWPVANHSLTRLYDPRGPDRRDWANALAYSQFNCQELRDGTCWSHVRDRARKPLAR